MPAEFAGYFDFRWLMVGAVYRGKPGLSSPVQLAPVIKPSFPICTICIATFFWTDFHLAGDIGLAYMVLPFDTHRAHDQTVFFCIYHTIWHSGHTFHISAFLTSVDQLNVAWTNCSLYRACICICH